MSIDPIKSLIDNASQLIGAITKGTEAEGTPLDFLAPIMGFMESFADFDLVKILTDFGNNLNNIVATGKVPFVAGFQLGTIAEPGRHLRDTIRRGTTGTAEPVTPQPESVATPDGTTAPTYLTPEQAKERAAPKKPTPEFEAQTDEVVRLAKTKSALVLDKTAMDATLAHINTTHAIITVVISVLSVLAEIASLGQLDTLLASIQSVYTLFDEPGAFYKIRDARIEMMYERPYRYMMERELQNVIPPPADAGRFLAKELIGPEEYDEIMSFWGIAGYYADLYRRARYIELPAQTTYELLHKGIINDEQAETLLRIADYNPSQIDNLVELSYDLPNRTEIRVMRRRTNIPDDLVNRALAASGLKEEYQPYLLEMLDNWNLQSIQTRTISEAIGQYQDGMIQEVDFLTIAIDNRASETEAKAYLNEATLKREARRKSDRVKTIRKAFKGGLLTYSLTYQDEMKKHFPDMVEADYDEVNVYFALMLELGFNRIDIEIMLDKDRIDSKDAAFIESMAELIAGITDREPLE